MNQPASESSPPVSTGGAVTALVIEELSIGGAEQMVVAMANQLVQLGWQVHVVCLRDAGALAAELDDSIVVHVLHKKPGLDLFLPWRLNRCLHRINPLVVNSHLWVGNTWTRLALLLDRLPVVVTEHSRDVWKPRYYRWIDRILAYRTAAMIAVSGDTAAFYREEVGVDPALVTVVNNGVNTRKYAAGDGRSLREEWLGNEPRFLDMPEDRRVLIGTVGRLVLAKNHRRLIDALGLLRHDPALQDHDIRLIVVGDGEDRDEIEAYVQKTGLLDAVTFTGARRDIPDVLAAFDLFVLSSDREGHPLTALEAQAAGTPVVLTDAGGSSEAIAREGASCGGVLVERSTEALAAALREMILFPRLRAERGAFARHHALLHFDQKRMIERYIEIFRAVSRN
ncbi:glycosyltransferase [Granulosicoccus sp. 3-233]|uniref:glycosyltransferase n=1 Tax=Granulosicoccus sp. 3-233 TaxID=3417969 RepID=UPI003D332E49